MIRITAAPRQLAKSQSGSGAPVPDCAVCEWDGRRFDAVGRSGAEMKLARMLVEAGCPDQPWESYTPSGTRSLFGSSLHGLAKLTVSETDQGIKRRRFQEYAAGVAGHVAVPAALAPSTCTKEVAFSL